MASTKFRVQWLMACCLLGGLLLLFTSCQQQTPAPSASSGQAPATPPSTGPAATQVSAQTSPADSATPPTAATKPSIDYVKLGFHYPPAPTRAESTDRAAGNKIKNALCVACHQPAGGAVVSQPDQEPPHTDRDSMHTTGVVLACVDCHGGGDPSLKDVPKNIKPTDPGYADLRRRAHITPTIDPAIWDSSARPQIAYTQWLKQNLDFVRFINPGDLRAARVACAPCHDDPNANQHMVHDVSRSMMAHGAMLWEAALYNNGAIDRKVPIYGEAYTLDGRPAAIVASRNSWPTVGQARDNGLLTALFPMPRWEITQPGNILRVFERGGMFGPNLGIPESEEDPGRPDVKLSVRGFGTNLRTDPVFIGLQKTRLLDPTLIMMGTNDHPGDFRSSGCSACHVVYANDRNPVHSSFWANFGNRGESFSIDAAANPPANPSTQPATQPYVDPYKTTIATRSSGHPIQHSFTRFMPTSSCIVCHVHPGTNVLNSYLGFMWWDNETDGKFMYSKTQVNPTAEQEFAVSEHNPEATAARGLWSNLYPDLENFYGQKAGKDFLENVTRFNKDPRNQYTQFADFHGHGWVFRAVFKQDREGRMLDFNSDPVKLDPSPDTIAQRMSHGVHFAQTQPTDKHPPANVPVHLKDIHLEKGMQCVDCHFITDAHGDGNLYGETRNAVAVNCVDCHGTIEERSPILNYFKAVDAGKDDDAKKYLMRAFSGNAAAVGLTPEQLRKRNSDIIKEHFSSDGSLSIDGLAQIKTSYVQAAKTGLPLAPGIDPTANTWTVTQTADTLKDGFLAPDADPDKGEDARRGKLARYAHTVRRDPTKWGTAPQPGDKWPLAHPNTKVSCYACHSSWNTSCFGCHLPQRANQRKPMLHNEGQVTRNYTNYNYQTLRNDIYMLGVDSTVKNHQVVPVRSACAIVVSSQNVNRDWIYSQQQTVSAEGLAGTAFSPNFPHTVRSAETKQCTDCHISKAGDNNALMAQLLMQGTNAVNFIGRYAWVAEGDGGLEAVAVSERDEPQAVIGSRLHEIAYPDNNQAHVAGSRRLREAYGHSGTVLDVQLRGEYLYAACGSNGFIAYDVANIDNKDFSERIITAPVSPLGQRFYVPSKYATSICSPSTLAIDPARSWTQEDSAKNIPGWRPQNEEGKITPIGSRTVKNPEDEHRWIPLLYGFLYLTDRDEGLIVIGNAPDNKSTGPGVTTLLDGEPRNNFLQRALTYNPGGLLAGARHMDLYGTFAYISCDAGLVVLDLTNPLAPQHVATLNEGLTHPHKVQFQFRYGFVTDDQGLKVIDVTFPAAPALVKDAFIPILDARDVYVCRTYGYVAAGNEGLFLIDLKRPEKPVLDRPFTDEGRLNDATSVRVAMTNTSLFAYVADGQNGLKVIQLTSPEDTPTYAGFSPHPAPRVIAWYPTRGRAISLSKGVDRDRAVDESGNQLAVFGRRGSRPFTLEEQRRFYFHNGGQPGEKIYTVTDAPETDPLAPPPASP